MWASESNGSANSEGCWVSRLLGTSAASNPASWLRTVLLKMEARNLPWPTRLRRCEGGKQKSRRIAAEVAVLGSAARAPWTPEGRGHALGAARSRRLTSPQASQASPGSRHYLLRTGDRGQGFVRVPPSPPRPSVPRRIIGYLISPGLNSWLRGRWFRNREIRLDRSIFSKRGF